MKGQSYNSTLLPIIPEWFPFRGEGRHSIGKDVYFMKLLRFVFSQILPILFSYIFVGIAFGILFHEAGYGVWWSLAAGLFIYAGSMQIIMISLMAAGTPLFMMAVMTFFINGRHLFYGLAFLEDFRKIGRKSHWKYPYMALTVTDEVYSVLCSMKCPEGIDREKAQFAVCLLCHTIWTVSCVLGGIIGGALPFDITGIDFSITAFFIVVVVSQWMQFASHLPIIIGFLCAVCFCLLMGGNFILPAMTVSAVLLMVLKDHIETVNQKGTKAKGGTLCE